MKLRQRGSASGGPRKRGARLPHALDARRRSAGRDNTIIWKEATESRRQLGSIVAPLNIATCHAKGDGSYGSLNTTRRCGYVG